MYNTHVCLDNPIRYIVQSTQQVYKRIVIGVQKKVTRIPIRAR